MKKNFVFFLTGVMLASFLFSEEYDIRKLKWGMTFEEIQRAEGLGSNFYKSEVLLGIRVEVLFGFDSKGLYSVTYSTRERYFANEVRKVMKKKYGEPKSDLDYSHLLKVKNILEKHPDAVALAFEDGDFSELDDIRSTDAVVNEKKVIRNALTKRDMWQYGNTIALLLDSHEGAALTYWSKTYHNENKKKFAEFFKELKKKVTKKKKKSDDADKF
ncbi:MAG: hypothetical protein PVH61_08075 [Candidatus Aminicenantes bacterium]|jgi:hypothetical protein